MTQDSGDRQQAVQHMLRQIPHLATFPSVALEVGRIVDDPMAGTAALRAIIAQDQALSTRVLRVSNSALFGNPGRIDSLDRAVFVLGFQAVRNIAIAASLDTLFRAGQLTPHVSSQDLWRHSLAVGAAAYLLEQRARRGGASNAFLAGLIHDIGITAEFQVDRLKLADVIVQCTADESLDFRQVEERVFGANHEDFGAALLEQWRFPPVLVLAAGKHHEPLTVTDEHRHVACLVHVADWMATACSLGLTLDVRPSAVLAPEVLAALRLTPEAVDAALAELPASVTEMEATLPAPNAA